MTLSLLEESYIDEIIESLRTSDIYSILDTIARFRDMHVNARGFFEQMMYRLRDKIVEHLDDRFYGEYMELYRMFEDAYTRVRAIPDGILLIEITLLKIVKRDYQTKIIEKDEVKPQKTREVKNEPRKTESINTEEKEEDSVISSEVIMESRHLAQKDILEQILPFSE